jgi:hypothetical protein
MAIQKKQVVVKDLCKMCTSTVCMCSGAHYIVKTEANNVILFLTMSKKGKILLYINMMVATTIFYRLLLFYLFCRREGGGWEVCPCLK